LRHKFRNGGKYKKTKKKYATYYADELDWNSVNFFKIENGELFFIKKMKFINLNPDRKKMKLYSLLSVSLFLALALCFSCGSGGINYKQADELHIEMNYFHNEGFKTFKTVKIKNQIEIKNFLSYIKDEESRIYECGYSGAMIPYKKGKKLAHMSFNIDPLCRHIIFSQKGKIVSKKLSTEGCNAFNELREKMRDK